HSASTAAVAAARFLHTHYRGGKILAQFFGSESVLFDARVSLGDNVYEGSYREWLPALADPQAHDIKWIVMRYAGPDQVAEALGRSPKLRPYTRVYQNAQYRIYEGVA